MKELIDSIKTALDNKNWYVALVSCLILPDICGKIEFPTLQSTSQRYVKWFNKYLLHKYTRNVGSERTKHVFLSGEDCYAFRCSLVHEGTSDITTQRVQQALTNFHFTIPNTRIHAHLNQFDSVLQLQVDCFCNEFIDGVNSWFNDIQTEMDKKAKLENLLKIVPPESIFSK